MKNIPQDVLKMLEQTDARHGFPAGTMLGILQQETGGRTEFLDKPDTYHYAPDETGKRIAKHTGKVSTAFGPFGILESTAKDPGYGVQPLRDKSLAEQVRFAGDYLAARVKQAGSFAGGLAGYGEGKGYAQQVVAKAGNQPAQAAPVQQVAAAPVADSPVVVSPVAANMPQMETYQGLKEDPWAAFQQQMVAKRVTPVDIAYEPLVAPVKGDVLIPDMPVRNPKGKVNFGMFSALKGLA